MWKTVSAAVSLQKSFLGVQEIAAQQLRTTFILQRKHPLMAHKKGREPRRMKPKHYIYELVKDTTIERQPDIEVILTSYVDGVGNPGDKVSVRPNYAYTHLLLPGLAVYASPENLKKYEDYSQKTEQVRYSSAEAMSTLKNLESMILAVVMNKDTPWTLKPWHIKAAFRKSGCMVPEEAITLPEKPISGPNMDLESKEFLVTVTVNKQEKVNVRCRIHHWSTDIAGRLPYVYYHWESRSEAVFPEDADKLASMPLKVSKKRKVHVNQLV